MNRQISRGEEALNVLRGNDRGGYTIPTHGLYPYQWNWDSAFAAMGFAGFDPARAWRELESLLSGQWDDGMVPHILFHQQDDGYFPGPEVWGGTGPIPSSGISQPPIAAGMARRIYQADPQAGAEPMRALFPKLLRWHRWFLKWREDQGAICTTHPWESGRDNAPEWDAALKRIDPVGVGEYQRRDTSHVDASMRPTKFDYDRYIWLVQQGKNLQWDQAALLKECPFRLADPTMSFTLLRAHRDLKALGDELGLDTGGMADEIALLERGVQSLWNAEIGSFDVRDTRSGEWSGIISCAAFLCWYAGIESEGQLQHLRRILGRVTYGVPSADPDWSGFDSKRYWRGPSWPFMNMLIGSGLIEAGHSEGEKIRAMTQELLLKHGFSEYYDPLSGEPAGGGKFTWTAAVWLGWVSVDKG
ncbi:MGH1-like glycoside hydrolase domain-containing protein [Paracoccus saliphilus]|uniref:Mannosylglycerate hydrolase MGH1-like glycoside hydrolase domain-containing protein n=1 Tax=Paracoccus saliphilus TaxID=405559 RepID=A0AA45W502_9RHOB|nr:hypothetical protein [Paracoccus saliphilus]WCR02102.1 hypothetical protein JHX88_14485 [Paracoccus saliphilus]SIS90020.1 hypothetical protein SAMN05421772_10817 [Paracoccus saliphilus]